MNTTRNSLKKKIYLHALDNINKYNLWSVYDSPKVRSVNLKINCNSCGINENDQFKFLCYYILSAYFLNFPKIIYSIKGSSSLSNHKNIDSDKNSQYSFFFTLSDLQDINNLLSKISLNKNSSVKRPSELNYSIAEIRRGSFTLFIHLPLLSDLKELFLSLGKDLRISSMKMELTIKISGNFLSPSFHNNEYFIKNLPLLG